MSSDAKQIQTVFEHVQYLLTSAAVMVGGAAIVKYHQLVSNIFPEAAILAGIYIALVGLGLASWSATHGWFAITLAYNSRIKGFIYGGFYVLLALSTVMAIFFAALSSQ